MPKYDSPLGFLTQPVGRVQVAKAKAQPAAKAPARKAPRQAQHGVWDASGRLIGRMTPAAYTRAQRRITAARATVGKSALADVSWADLRQMVNFGRLDQAEAAQAELVRRQRPDRTVVAKADDAGQVAVYDNQGNVVGLTDPGSITPVVSYKDTQEPEPSDDGSALGDDLPDPSGQIARHQEIDTKLVPAPSASVGTRTEDMVAKARAQERATIRKAEQDLAAGALTPYGYVVKVAQAHTRAHRVIREARARRR